jgi:hypothetical protein
MVSREEGTSIPTIEQFIILGSTAITLLLLIFAVNWRYFRDWIAVFLFTGLFGFLWGSPVVNLKLIKYPVRLFPHYYDTSILFEVWVLPVLCILYNQCVRGKGAGTSIYYALLFSVGMTAIEYPLERYTGLIKYMEWSWLTSFFTLTGMLLLSRMFVVFYRWGCDYFSDR